MPIDIIDLFAGPGGLGEGFASLNDGKTFRIAVSAEMESSAHRTLTLRSFYRMALHHGDEKALNFYYDYCNDEAAQHPSEASPKLWAEAKKEAQKLTLGEAASNAELDRILKAKNLDGDNTVLIGGPPCQAYSLVGRSRNLGKPGYVAEDDSRHYLYKQYLRIIASRRPAVFVMENVKGILSSKLGGNLVFEDILRDLTNPAKAMGEETGERYVIHSLSKSIQYDADMDPGDIDPRSFIVRAEDYGLPQARHRVILLGIRETLRPKQHPLLTLGQRRTVASALQDLPSLRSRLSKDDGASAWHKVLQDNGIKLAHNARDQDPELATKLKQNVYDSGRGLPVGAGRWLKTEKPLPTDDEFLKWVRDTDDRLKVWLHHEARSHMASDLVRYFFASTFAQVHGRSPKGHTEFLLPGLAPAHANWNTGKFADRFRVQCYAYPSTTVTSHIAKDGHYFIHPDPIQCRSLTIREAARLQTFKDNYFFEGNRTQKYHQVGNAVPSMLANQIAKIVANIFNSPS